jgi:hypothetical protein
MEVSMPTSQPLPTGVTEHDIDQILASIGLSPAITPNTPPPPADDPAVIAATKAQARARKNHKPISQFITYADDRLGQLFHQFYLKKPKLDVLEAQVKELTSSIKSAISAQAPGVDHTIQLYCGGSADGLAMVPYPKKKTDWDRLAAARPDVMAIINAYTTTETEWQLRRIRGSK